MFKPFREVLILLILMLTFIVLLKKYKALGK
jgi:hypothetical protein